MQIAISSGLAVPGPAGENRRGSKADQVYAEIKLAILTGGLEPGAPIDKLALCAKLGVSRFPVSTAINRLAYERLVVIEPQHGSFVGKIAATDVREWMMIRRGIETEMAGELAGQMGENTGMELQRNLRYQQAAQEAGDNSGFYLLDVEFHRLLAGGLRLTQTVTILEGLRSSLERIRRLLLAPTNRMELAIGEHRAIFAALAARDSDGARHAMRDHLKQTSSLFEDFARSQPGMFSA